MGWINKKILEVIIKVISDFLYGVIDKFSSLLNDVFSASKDIVNGTYVKSLTSFSLTFAISILVLLAIAQLIKLYILPDSGEPEENISGYFIRLGKTVILVTFSSEVCTIIVNLSDYIASDVLKIVGKSKISNALKGGINSLDGIAFKTAIAALGLIAIALIAIIIIIYQATKRAVEMVVLQIVAPIFAVNYLTTDKGLWNKWLQTMLSVALTYVFQVALVNIGLKFIVNGIDDALYMVVGLAWLGLAITSPKILKEFAYSSSIGNTAKSIGSIAIHNTHFKKKEEV